MSKPYDEKAFENEIASALLNRGYVRVPSDRFDAERGIFPQQIVSFVKETQPEAWEKLETAHKGNTRQRFLQELTSALERQGTLELLRHGLRTTGTKIDLATFQPNTGINPELQRKYDANVLGSDPTAPPLRDEPGPERRPRVEPQRIPVATAELKNTFTDQSPATPASSTARTATRANRPPVQARRARHFAIDQNEVYYTTELDGEDTNFLPFNKGHEKGGGNPPREDDHRTPTSGRRS